MSDETHSAQGPRNISSAHSQPRFQFITVSDPFSTKEAVTKTIIRKHVMGEVGRARRLPNKRGKQLTISLVVPPRDEWTHPSLPLKKVRLDEASAADGEIDLEHLRHDSLIAYSSSHIVARSGSFHSLPRTDKVGCDIIGPFVSTEAYIGELNWLGAGLLDPFTKYPFEMGQSDRALVAHIFRLVFHDPDGSQHAFRDAWYSVGLSDPAAFHLVLSNSAAHLNYARRSSGGWQSAEEMVHYTLALRSVNERFKIPANRISDSIIGAIAGFICHNNIKGQYDQWHVHRKGIKDMITLRGGIAAFDEKKELRLTIMWVDLSGAYAQDIMPQFPFPYHLSHRRVWQDAPLYNLQAGTSPLFKYCVKLQIDLADLIGSISQMEAEIKFHRTLARAQHQQQAIPNGDWTNPIIHQLLTIRLMCINDLDRTSHSTIISEACRLGLLLFLAEIRRRCGVKPTRTTTLVEKLKTQLCGHPAAFQKSKCPLFLWLLMMGAMEALPSSKTGLYFHQNLRVAMDESHVKGGGGLLDILRGVLWSDEVHTTGAESVQMAVEAVPT